MEWAIHKKIKFCTFVVIMQKKIGFFSIDIATYGFHRRIKLREQIGIELAGSAAALMLILLSKLHFF